MKQTISSLLSALFTASLFVGAPVYAQDIDMIRNGRAIADRICAECHAIRKGDPQSPNGLAPSFAALATTPGMTKIALNAALQTSHRLMPNIILADEDRRGVIAYIMSLQ